MKYCKKCLQPDTRPGELFDSQGICLGCRNFYKSEEIGYEERFNLLKDLIKKYKSKKVGLFDCLIGVSGGKDSLRQAIWVRDKLHLNPLLISFSYPPDHVTDRGVKNFSNLIERGFNVYISSPGPKTFKNLMKESFLRYGNWAKASEMALYTSVPNLAIKFGIRLIFNGEDPGQKEIFTEGKEGWDHNNLRDLNTLGGGNIDWMIDLIGSENKLLPYKLPSKIDFENSGLQIIDLGWFLGDWSFNTNGKYGILNGMQPRSESVKFSGDLSFVSSVDEDFVTVNQFLKYSKFGYSKVTDFLNEEIRCGRVTRDKAINLVEKYDGNCSSELIDSFCKHLGISKYKFWEIVERFTNKKLFNLKKESQGFRLLPKFEIGAN